MKNLSISLLIVFLGLSLCFSCGSATGGDAQIDGEDMLVQKKAKNNPTEKLSKEEVLERMNNANKNRSKVDPSIEEMVARKKSQGGKIGADQAEQSSREVRRKYEEVKDVPPTAKQKQIGNNICACLNKNPLFSSLSKTKSAKDLIKKAGEDKDKEVKALQDCYNNNMVPAISKLGDEAGIFAMKSRTFLNKKCLDGTDNFWINVGAYLVRNKKKAEVEINMPEVENGMLLPPTTNQ